MKFIKSIQAPVLKICFAFLLLSNASEAQQTVCTGKNTVQFLTKLVHQNRSEDVLYYINHLKLGADKQQNDSILYLKSYSLVENGLYKELLSSQHHFNEVDRLESKSSLLTAYCYLHLQMEDSAIFHANQLGSASIVKLLKASSYLLKFDTTASVETLNLNSENDTAFYSNLQVVRKLCHQMPKPKKSAWVAGLLSAAVPGMGKIYAGQKKNGLSILYTLAPLGLLVAENIYRIGFKKTQTICFASVFAVFYIGNIVGSAYSPKAFYENQHEKFRKDVLSNIYFPIRDICRP